MNSLCRCDRKVNKSGVKWFYEYKSFPYTNNNGKLRTYTPDFYLVGLDKYGELGKRRLNFIVPLLVSRPAQYFININSQKDLKKLYLVKYNQN